MLQSGDADSAVTVLQEFTRTHSESAEGFRLLAEAHSAVNQEAASHLAYAEYYALNDEFHSAIDQLNLAMVAKEKDFYQTTRIEARLAQLQQLERQQKLDTME